jgi:hypothetical protein
MNMNRVCEIIYVTQKHVRGWKWRPLADGAQACQETYALFYECVAAARARGYGPENLKCR